MFIKYNKTCIRRRLFSIMINHFQVLGVDINSNDDEIKKSFYQKAKRLHPDVASNISIEEANIKFIELKNAYDILSNPESRLLYLTQLNRQKLNEENYKYNHHNSSNHVNNDYQYYEHNYNYNNDNDNYIRFDEDEIRARNLRRRRRKRYNTNTITSYQNSWDDFKKELESALDKAYYGPVFYKNNIQEYPEQFEVEIRKNLPNKQQDIDIMHIVSGRQKLGYIYIPSSSSSSSSFDDTIDKKNQDILHLHYDNKLYAKATRKLNNDRNNYSIYFEKIDDDDNNNNNNIKTIYMGKIIKTENYDLLFNHNDEETHRIVTKSMPGVKNIYFHSFKGFVELKMSHAILPPEYFWLWYPRDIDFTRSWYYECNKGGKYSRNRNNNNNNNNIENILNSIEKYDEKNHLDVSVSVLYLGFKELDKLK